MDDSKIYEPTDSELEILQIIWANEPTTVRFVFEQINLKRKVGYTTVLKQLQRLTTDKGVVKRELKGKTHYYSVIPKQSDVQSNMFKRFVNTVYQGSAMNLVMHALGQSKTSAEELEELQQWIEAQKKQQDD